MAQIKFSIEGDGEGMNIDIEGQAGDLINLMANAINGDEDIKMIVTMALLAVEMKDQMDNGDEDSELAEVFSKIKPTAEA